MIWKTRYLQSLIQEDLQDRKMVFIGGPRQVGKTTLALNLLKAPSEQHPAYLNWDDRNDKSLILKGEIPLKQKLIVFDEIHKFTLWRNLLKGLYDKHKSTHLFIITGSARLDYYRKGGDSLQGRYHYYRLHPFSTHELNSHPSRSDIDHLLAYGGFPEPLFRGNERFWKRWQRERLERILEEDLRDLENVREVSLIELLLENLPQRTGSPLSIKNIKEVLNVSHETVERWISILENLYVCFRIAPFGAPKIRAVKKEQKLYFWDWTQSPQGGIRFENFVACQLLKYCHFLEDSEGYKMELRYIRDTDKREVDFVVLQDHKPLFAVECKTGESHFSPAAFYFKERTSIPKFYQVHLGTKDVGDEEHGIRVLPFTTFIQELHLP